MASSAGPPGPVSPETYWKRRVFVLAGLLVMVALITYACTRPSSPETDEASGAESSPSPTKPAPSSPSVSPSPPPSDGPSASPSAGKGDDKGDDSADKGGSGDDSGSGDKGAEGEFPAPKQAEDPCQPSDVVVTLAMDKSDYAWDEKPKIELTVVNTAKQTCTVDLGPKAMEVRISSGEDRVYSTADCAKGSATDKKQLKRGVPATTTFTWDRKRSWEKCPKRDVTAKRPGTYVASLHSDYHAGAEKQVFRLN